jgi:hypothetical protein
MAPSSALRPAEPLCAIAAEPSTMSRARSSAAMSAGAGSPAFWNSKAGGEPRVSECVGAPGGKLRRNPERFPNGRGTASRPVDRHGNKVTYEATLGTCRMAARLILRISFPGLEWRPAALDTLSDREKERTRGPQRGPRRCDGAVGMHSHFDELLAGRRRRQHGRTVGPGSFDISVGSSSRDPRLTAKLEFER